VEPLPEADRPQPAVLVVHGCHAARGGDAKPRAHRLDVLVVRDPEVALLESPGALLAKHARRLAPLVHLDHAALRLQVAVRGSERGRVEP
jgi:hypothetical protein